ncbi:hypothetical protein PPERSA_04818 [Pseudocohnilembus persalinus]|uniref:Uncharacterized protein n=1 Tax=Pseudocohnilembus persalinus TaxID=266149 RepID=A0A0V0QL39_PSEPJ|nr:hypothetical protein PPERSA_04818 [Pseudocohnilembus persalinus]|eukprot:KRX03023.1 hypothetical protein PPERSA_04818 [Pseudocohnilembus persalinus]
MCDTSQQTHSQLFDAFKFFDYFVQLRNKGCCTMFDLNQLDNHQLRQKYLQSLQNQGFLNLDFILRNEDYVYKIRKIHPLYVEIIKKIKGQADFENQYLEPIRRNFFFGNKQDKNNNGIIDIEEQFWPNEEEIEKEIQDEEEKNRMKSKLEIQFNIFTYTLDLVKIYSLIVGQQYEENQHIIIENQHPKIKNCYDAIEVLPVFVANYIISLQTLVSFYLTCLHKRVLECLIYYFA